MKIAYYMPFKPMGHTNPSGDLIIGTELFNHLSARGHSIKLASRLRCRWIYYRPGALFRLLQERLRLSRKLSSEKPDLWLSYHSYYKAPDLLGPACSQKMQIPYVIFQGIYSTKRRKKLRTLPGFLLNRRTLLSADHVFANKKRDYANLKRLLPDNRLSYIAPGINPAQFVFADESRRELRSKWHAEDDTIIMTAAMMRPGVKTEGIARVIRSCIDLYREGEKIRLVIAGDGSTRTELEHLATALPAERVTFLGKIDRSKMSQIYSTADIFAFPGVEEALGMVYLEAQACRLPVIAFEDWGGGEAVIHGSTGLLSPASQPPLFTANLLCLVRNTKLRQEMGKQASHHIRDRHDLHKNYRSLEKQLIHISGAG